MDEGAACQGLSDINIVEIACDIAELTNVLLSGHDGVTR
jgi:hypothetical protein